MSSLSLSIPQRGQGQTSDVTNTRDCIIVSDQVTIVSVCVPGELGCVSSFEGSHSLPKMIAFVCWGLLKLFIGCFMGGLRTVCGVIGFLLLSFMQTAVGVAMVLVVTYVLVVIFELPIPRVVQDWVGKIF